LDRTLMSVRELKRIEVLGRVKAGVLKVKDAAVLLGVCERHAKRLWRRYRRKGPAALRHQSVGRRSNRAKRKAWRRKVVELYRRKYAGDVKRGEAPFGPTLAAEHLHEEDGVEVHPETLRRVLMAEGLWARKRKRVLHRQRRERKAHFGELVQIDGSFHAWLEGRGPRGCLIEAIDDATSTVEGRFSEQETIWAAAAVLRRWIERYGIPHALYTDWKNVYLREPTEAERASGRVARTQFGRMCDKLGIQIIGARSPQAKGRVERVHGTSQDRLIKKLRRKGIREYDAANAYVAREYFVGHNARFARTASSETDFHTPVPRLLDLDEVFRLETEHALGNDWVVRHDNRYFQVQRQSRYAPARSTVLVCEDEDGRLAIEYRGQKLAFGEIPAPSSPAAAAKPAVATPNRSSTPGAQHPWRRAYREMPDRRPWPTRRPEGCGNDSGVDAPRTSVHPALELSRRARDSHIPTSP
jgi:transposase